MSSRVQKGGQKFKPVAKPRGRPTDGTPNAPKKPRGSTVEPFRVQPSQQNKGQVQDTRIPSVNLTTRFTAAERAEGHTITHDQSNTADRARTHELASSSNIVGTGYAVSVATPSIVEGAHSSTTLDEIIAPPFVNATIASRAMPIATPSCPQPPPPTLYSRAQSILQQHIPASSQVLPLPEPNLHTLLDNVSPLGNNITLPHEASQLYSQVTLGGPEGASMPVEINGTVTDRQVDSSAVLNNIRPQESEAHPTKRNIRKRTGASKESDIENAGVTGAEDNAIENRMTRKRRASTKSRKSSVGGATNVQVQDGPSQIPRRSSRAKRPTSMRSETQEPPESLSDGPASDSDTEKRKKRPRRSSTASSSTTMKGRRSRNTVVFDPDTGPGEELDPTAVTMAAICDDTGQGRISSKAALIQSNHLAWKTANKQKRDRMRAALEAKKFSRKEDEDGGQAQTDQPEKEDMSDGNESQVAGSSGTPAVEDATGSGFNYKESLLVNRVSAQVRIGPNGETIIDEESLFVDRAQNAEDGMDVYQHVEESDQTKFTNSASYGRKVRGSRWSAEETELFYDALSQFGENYELISYVLPGRDRKACKSKFKAEDKKNSNRITYCLNNRIPYDMQTLSRLTGKDFSGPTPEIVAPPMLTLVEDPQDQQLSESEQPGRKSRKKSRTPAVPDDVEVVGDVETFEVGVSDA